MNKNKAIVASAIVFLLVFTVRYFVINFRDFAGPGDFFYSWTMARNVLQGFDPYDGPRVANHSYSSAYPFTSGVIALPFTPLPDRLAAALFFSLTAALLTGALLMKTGQWWRLLLLFSVPFVSAMEWTQWSPLITAGWYIPMLAPLMILIKPQITLPIFINRFRKTRYGYILAAAVLAVSLIISPAWPIHWWKLAQGYDFHIPLLLPGGFLLALALLNISDERARLLLVMAILPFRTGYDLLPLFIIPQTPVQMIVLLEITWLAPTQLLLWYITALVFVLVAKDFRSLTIGIPFLNKVLQRRKPSDG